MNWYKYKIISLFYIVIGKNIDGNKADRTGDWAYITRKESDNGLDGFINGELNLLNIDYPVITIGNETATPFVQNYPFFTGTKVNILKPKFPNSNYILAFIATSLRQHKNKYSYSYTINSSRLKEQVILLPGSQNGNPDFEFMETYMRNQENEQIVKYLENLVG